MPFSPATKPIQASETQQVMDALRRIVQAVRRSSAQGERASGLTSAQVLILKLLKAQDGLSAGRNKPADATQFCIIELLLEGWDTDRRFPRTI